MLLLFMMCGSYEWTQTNSLQSVFNEKMLKAESFIDLQSLQAMKTTLRKCLLLNDNEEPIDRISELLPSLQKAKEACEKILK